MWHMIYQRFGGNNQILVMKYTTLFTSYEFHMFIQLVIDGGIHCEEEEGPSQSQLSSAPATSRVKSQSGRSL